MDSKDQNLDTEFDTNKTNLSLSISIHFRLLGITSKEQMSNSVWNWTKKRSH